MKRALTISNIEAYKPNTLPFTGEWEAAVGCPELSGSWLIWGNSGNGKTRVALQLCKYLCRFCRVAYDSVEEGLSLSMQAAIKSVGMRDVSRNFIFLDKEPVSELIERLKQPKSPDVVVLDSVQYTGLNYASYKQLRDTFRRKLFILISHADGKNPAGRVAGSIRYDANVKIFVEGYKAYPVSRYGGGETYTIWADGADKF